MKDGMKALTTAMAHVTVQQEHAKKVKGLLKDRANQYAEVVIRETKRLDVPLGDALAPGYDADKRLKFTREKGILDNITSYD